MQRKPGPAPGAGFPASSCAIKLPDSLRGTEQLTVEELDGDLQQRRRQQLINFAHSQWGFNNWSWAVTKQELDFIDFANGKYSAGVVAFVSVTVKKIDISREDIGYATTLASQKGSAVFQARKCAVTNALRETLLSFGGSIATELLELLESNKTEAAAKIPQVVSDIHNENNQNIANKPQNIEKLSTIEPKNASVNKNIRKNSSDSSSSRETPVTCNNVMRPHPNLLPQPPMKTTMPVAAGAVVPPVAKTQPSVNHTAPIVNKPATYPANHMPPKAHHPTIATPASVPGPPISHVRPNSNVSFVLQPVMPGVVPQLYAPPPNRMPMGPQHIFPNAFYADYAPWHFAYEGYDRHHGNVNLNFNIPPKNLVVNSRSGTVEYKNSCSPGKPLPPGEEHAAHHALFNNHHNNPAGCWIKPTIFYDGFWTEQKVKKWVTEQVEKQFPDEFSNKSTSPGNNHMPNNKV